MLSGMHKELEGEKVKGRRERQGAKRSQARAQGQLTRAAREREVLALVVAAGASHPIVAHPREVAAAQEKRRNPLPNVGEGLAVCAAAVLLARVNRAVRLLRARPAPAS